MNLPTKPLPEHLAKTFRLIRQAYLKQNGILICVLTHNLCQEGLLTSEEAAQAINFIEESLHPYSTVTDYVHQKSAAYSRYEERRGYRIDWLNHLLKD